MIASGVFRLNDRAASEPLPAIPGPPQNRATIPLILVHIGDTNEPRGFPDTSVPPDKAVKNVGENQTIQPDVVPPEVAKGTNEEPVLQSGAEANPKPHRLVPDFGPGNSDQPLPHPNSRFFLEPKLPRDVEPAEVPADRVTSSRRFRALLAVVIVVAAVAVAGVGWRLRNPSAPAVPVASQENRPIGLYVDPTAETWRISWNRDAAALAEARETRLLVKDGEEQNVIELTPDVLAAASAQFTPKGRDVTFRMESTAKDAKVTAESFRILRAAAENPKSAPHTAASDHTDFTPPKATHRVAPVVAAKVRPRIKGRVPVDIRAEIDTRGRVTSAVPVNKPREALEVYLTERAQRAAREWHFEPARKDGKRVAGSQVIHFVFER